MQGSCIANLYFQVSAAFVHFEAGRLSVENLEPGRLTLERIILLALMVAQYISNVVQWHL